ncbi:monovalent cation:proton antiporter-2 (CPA2) family protein [Coralliovum pocilloporae]|uniref:monovalent cation:proton antiporter-2 (CPA2) family protein n=1 Tax=Coralliovum pocilloporae TaxID=3066369 RepID=UPI0033071AB6
MEHGSLLFQAFVYLAAAVVSVPLAKRLGLGSVLGYLIAGVLIGPFGLHLAGNTADVMHFAEFGVVMMLFLVGLELHPTLLWRMRWPILGIGGAQMVITAFAIALIGYLSGLDWRLSIATGLVLASSSTAIVLQTLTERGHFHSPVGKKSFAVLLFQDIAIIPILAILPFLSLWHSIGLEPDTPDHRLEWIAGLPGWSQGLAVLVAVVVTIAAGRFLLHPAFRYIADARMREIFVAFALVIVVGIALLMQSVGLSPALGTFIAGVVLAESEFRKELESDIEPFKGMLLGLFFLSVGASIDFSLFLKEIWFIVALVIGLITVKTAILIGLGLAAKLKLSESILFGFLLSQGGEFGFVLIAFAVQNTVMTATFASPLIVAVALSMAITPLLLILYQKVIEPIFARRQQQEQAEQDDHDPDDIHGQSRVIIAGFGRFGQITGRMMMAAGYEVTVLDFSPSQIEMLKRFGNKVYFGDASRMDMLWAAGATDAEVLIITVKDPDKVLEIIDTAQAHFPHLKILARATDRRHVYELMKRDVDGIFRETFGSSLDMGVSALKHLGLRAYQAERLGKIFRRHDEESLSQLADLWGDDVSYGVAVRKRTQDLIDIISSDKVGFDKSEVELGWNSADRDESEFTEGDEGTQTPRPAARTSDQRLIRDPAIPPD